ncbi:MAG: N-acyl-D-amino-acid deacylase family protein [Burkholderiales bacterium]
MSYDVLIKNGTVVDGTGAPGYAADLAVKDGRILEIGKPKGDAAKIIDAAGQVVCPGFIDPHTHYDPQISWDRLLESSSEHGITTVVLGNCGVGVAPCRPEHHDLLCQDLITVEGMEADVLKAGIQWDWETFPQYMDAAEKRGTGPNLAFLVPLAPARTYVLGLEGPDRAATADETKAITRLLTEAVDAGAWGWSTTAIRSHVGFHGKPLSARAASRDELAAYAQVLKKSKRGIIELALTKRFANLDEDEMELLGFLLDHSERPVTWLSLHNLTEKPDAVPEILAKADALIRRRGLPQILTRPLIAELTLKSPFQFTEIVAAKGIFNQPVEKQMQLYGDRAFRDAFREELKLGRKFTNQAQNVGVFKAADPKNVAYEGRTIGEIAAERKADPLDCLFDFAMSEKLETKFILPRANTNRERIPELLRESDRTLIGLSDGGAHVDMFCEAGYTTYMLGHWVREKKALTLEHAVKRMTSEPADFLGIADRGRLKAGLAADIVVFDPATVNSPTRGSMVYDLPAGGGRLVAKASGVASVIVNGKPLFEKGTHTGAFPGRVLRSNA